MVVAFAALSGCGSKADEPAGASALPADPHVAPLVYTAPASWQKTGESDEHEKRAVYVVPKMGDDKEDGEALVLFFGTGSAGDRDKQWDPWFQQFDGDAKKDATRTTFETHGITVETFEFAGNYKLNLGPHRPGQVRSPVQMVKNNYRMIGAVARTKDRGNWFFRLVGADATVTAAKPDFLAMLQSVE
jgi:hypothetical protein